MSGPLQFHSSGVLSPDLWEPFDGCPKMDSQESYPPASLSGLLNYYTPLTPLQPVENQLSDITLDTPKTHYIHLQHAVLGRSSLSYQYYSNCTVSLWK